MTRPIHRHRPAPRLSLARRRAFVARSTRLQPLVDVPSIRLHLADDIDPVWRATARALGDDEPPIPFWAAAWAGGIGLARYIIEHPSEVADRTVIDLATGSGLCAIAAVQSGAAVVTAIDIDPFAEAAVALNARANAVPVAFVGKDLLDEEPPPADVILAGDTWYEAPLAERVAPWLRSAAARGTRVLVGDPGRRYLPVQGLEEVGWSMVHTTSRLEDQTVVTTRVYAVTPASGSRTPRFDRYPSGVSGGVVKGTRIG